MTAGTPEDLLAQIWDHRDRYSIPMLLHGTELDSRGTHVFFAG